MTKLTLRQPAEIAQDADVLELVDEWTRRLDLLVSTDELSANTRASYVRGWGKFADWLTDQDTNFVDSETIRAWIGDLKAQGYKTNTINSWLSGVRSFFDWAVGMRRLLFNPLEGVKSVSRRGKTTRHKRDVLTSKEVLKLLAQPDRSTDQGKRDYAMLCLMAYCALRSVEIIRADVSDLRTEGERLVLYVQGKGAIEADDFVVLAKNEVSEAVYDWIAVRGGLPGPLFVSLSNRNVKGRLTTKSVRRMFQEYKEAAGIVDPDGRKTVHSLRHTAITNAILHGAAPQAAQKMARHANIQTTLDYYHAVDRLENPAEERIDYTNGKH